MDIFNGLPGARRGPVLVAGAAASPGAQLQSDGDPMGMNVHPGTERYLSAGSAGFPKGGVQ
jgi:hypothetical protein